MSQADDYFASGDYDSALSIYYDLDGFGDSYQRITVIDVFRQLENKSSVSYLYDAVSRLADNGIDVRISYNTAGTSNTSDVTDTEEINGYDYFYGFSQSATKSGYTLDGWDFLAGRAEQLAEDWQNFAQKIVEEYPGKTIVAVTSNGIARFSKAILPAGAVPEGSLKLATGAFGIYEYTDGVWSSTQWNVRPQL